MSTFQNPSPSPHPFNQWLESNTNIVPSMTKDKENQDINSSSNDRDLPFFTPTRVEWHETNDNKPSLDDSCSSSATTSRDSSRPPSPISLRPIGTPPPHRSVTNSPAPSSGSLMNSNSGNGPNNSGNMNPNPNALNLTNPSFSPLGGLNVPINIPIRSNSAGSLAPSSNFMLPPQHTRTQMGPNIGIQQPPNPSFSSFGSQFLSPGFPSNQYTSPLRTGMGENRIPSPFHSSFTGSESPNPYPLSGHSPSPGGWNEEEGDSGDEMQSALDLESLEHAAYEEERRRSGDTSPLDGPRSGYNSAHSSGPSSHNNSRRNSGELDNPFYLPALPTFPGGIHGGINQMILNLTPEQVQGNVVRLAKSHAGSRFIQQKLEAHDPVFFSLFYDEMCDHVPELMVDNFGHFAIEKLILMCTDEQCLGLLTRLAPAIGIVACQKHGSFSVQALVDTLHTPSQVYTLVESIRPDIMRILTHASGHFVVLRMLQRFPYESTKFVDDAIVANIGQIGTDHHGLRIVKAILAVRRPVELTRLFKQVARLTMKLVENQYGNYVIQAILDVAPPGVRTNIKVKMEGKYMRLSKQKFSSNVVEKCLKQSSTHWRTIIIRELIAQPAVSELLRDRYGNYVLQTALGVANAQQVQEIVRSITPYLPSLRDNVRAKWKKMLRKAGSQAGVPTQEDELGEVSPPPSPSMSRSTSPGPGSNGLGMNSGNMNRNMNMNTFQSNPSYSQSNYRESNYRDRDNNNYRDRDNNNYRDRDNNFRDRSSNMNAGISYGGLNVNPSAISGMNMNNNPWSSGSNSMNNTNNSSSSGFTGMNALNAFGALSLNNNNTNNSNFGNMNSNSQGSMGSGMGSGMGQFLNQSTSNQSSFGAPSKFSSLNPNAPQFHYNPSSQYDNFNSSNYQQF